MDEPETTATLVLITAALTLHEPENTKVLKMKTWLEVCRRTWKLLWWKTLFLFCRWRNLKPYRVPVCLRVFRCLFVSYCVSLYQNMSTCFSLCPSISSQSVSLCFSVAHHVSLSHCVSVCLSISHCFAFSNSILLCILLSYYLLVYLVMSLSILVFLLLSQCCSLCPSLLLSQCVSLCLV